jgi:uncharacterized protein (TIGR00251 family)
LEGLKETPDGLLITAYVRPLSRKFAVSITNNGIAISTKSAAQDNKANLELLKELKRRLRRKVSIVLGVTSKEKVLLIQNCNIEDFKKAISSG